MDDLDGLEVACAQQSTWARKHVQASTSEGSFKAGRQAHAVFNIWSKWKDRDPRVTAVPPFLLLERLTMFGQISRE